MPPHPARQPSRQVRGGPALASNINSEVSAAEGGAVLHPLHQPSPTPTPPVSAPANEIIEIDSSPSPEQPRKRRRTDHAASSSSNPEPMVVDLDNEPSPSPPPPPIRRSARLRQTSRTVPSRNQVLARLPIIRPRRVIEEDEEVQLVDVITNQRASMPRLPPGSRNSSVEPIVDNGVPRQRTTVDLELPSGAMEDSSAARNDPHAGIVRAPVARSLLPQSPDSDEVQIIDDIEPIQSTIGSMPLMIRVRRPSTVTTSTPIVRAPSSRAGVVPARSIMHLEVQRARARHQRQERNAHQEHVGHRMSVGGRRRRNTATRNPSPSTSTRAAFVAGVMSTVWPGMPSQWVEVSTQRGRETSSRRAGSSGASATISEQIPDRVVNNFQELVDTLEHGAPGPDGSRPVVITRYPGNGRGQAVGQGSSARTGAPARSGQRPNRRRIGQARRIGSRTPMHVHRLIYHAAHGRFGMTTDMQVSFMTAAEADLDYEQLISLDEELLRDRNKADNEQIDALPVEIAKESDKEIRCCICMCDVEVGEELRVLPCGHKYHKPCIDGKYQCLISDVENNISTITLTL